MKSEIFVPPLTFYATVLNHFDASKRDFKTNPYWVV